jgi:polar amino acid transport system substrate-binding protein
MWRMVMRSALIFGLLPMPVEACNGTVTPDGTAPYNRPDIHGIAVFLPQVLENTVDSPFANLIRVVNKYYPAGRISLSIAPVRRVYLDISDQNADFRFPIMKIRDGADSQTPYQFGHEMLGKVSFVLYSNKARPLDKAAVLDMANLNKYQLAAPPTNWGFHTESVVDLERSLKMLNQGRIDGVIWAQEEADFLIRKLRLDNVHRSHFDDYPDVIFLSCNRRGNFVNQVLSKAIVAARASGELARAYAAVHQPYQDWQP